MNTYLLTILGVILLGVMVDIVLPSGSTSKYISGIFAIFVLFTIISPALNWIKSDYTLKDYFTSTEIELDNKLLHSMTNTRINEVENNIEQQLVDGGYIGVDISIEFELEENSVKITQVLADLKNLVINQNSENINKYVYIRQAVQSNIAVAEEVITFCE